MLNQKISPIQSGILLGGSVLLISILLSLIFFKTEPLIQKSIEANRLNQFALFLNESQYDNPLLEDKIELDDFTIYPAFKNNQLVMILIESVSSKGYSGDIHLITALDHLDKNPPRVYGVSVIQHRETPGLGDKIERKKSNWIMQFDQREFGDESGWQVSKNGGSFDSLTGATITSKAVIDEVKRIILNYEKIQKEINDKFNLRNHKP